MKLKLVQVRFIGGLLKGSLAQAKGVISCTASRRLFRHQLIKQQSCYKIRSVTLKEVISDVYFLLK